MPAGVSLGEGVLFRVSFNFLPVCRREAIIAFSVRAWGLVGVLNVGVTP